MEKTLLLPIGEGQSVLLEMVKPCRRQIIAVNAVMDKYGFDYFDYLSAQVDSYKKMKSLGIDEGTNFEDGNPKVLEFTQSPEFVRASKLQKAFFSTTMSLEMVKHIWVVKGGTYTKTLEKYGDKIEDYYGENPDAEIEVDLQDFFVSMQGGMKAVKKAKKETTPRENE